MDWQRGFKRIRIVAAAALASGVILLAIVLLTQLLGYAPNPGFVQIFGALWPLGLMLLVLGALLWLTVWVLAGFLPGNSVGEAGAPRARFYQ